MKLLSYFSGEYQVEWCEYVYDFGDSWAVDVKLIGVRSIKETFKRRLLDGDRSGPPEDCGGWPGYERVVHFRATGEDLHGDEHVDLGEWLGDWQPDGFDLEAARAAFDK